MYNQRGKTVKGNKMTIYENWGGDDLYCPVTSPSDCNVLCKEGLW